MKKLLILSTVFSMLFTTFSFGQKTINQKIKEVYGTATEQLKPDQLAWIKNCLSRTTVKELSNEEAVKAAPLQSVALIKKFATATSLDKEYDPLTFNPLKYSFNYFKKEAQTFRIGTTNFVIIIAPKAD